MDLRSEAEVGTIDSIKTIDLLEQDYMSTPLPGPGTPLSSQPARDVVPRRLIVTANVVIFAVRDWSLWVLQVYVWGSTEQGAAVSLIHSVLLRAHHDELRPNLQSHSVPSLRVGWTAVMEIESGQRTLDPEVRPVLQTALHTLRSQVQRDPEIVLRYLAGMGVYKGLDWWMQDRVVGKETRPMSILKEPTAGDGILTLAEAALLYRAFFPADEQIDLSNLRRRFLATNRLEPLDEERPVRGRELDWRRVSRAYRYQAQDE